MILTEKEARTKKCHRTLQVVSGGNGMVAAPCLASGCMAWKVVDDGHDHKVAYTPALEFELIRQGYVRVPSPDVGYSKPGARPPTGCCGLAERTVTVVQEVED